MAQIIPLRPSDLDASWEPEEEYRGINAEEFARFLLHLINRQEEEAKALVAKCPRTFYVALDRKIRFLVTVETVAKDTIPEHELKKEDFQ